MPWRGRADHPHTGVTRELQHAAHTPVGAVDQEGLPGPAAGGRHSGAAVQPLPGCDAVDDHRLGRPDFRRNRHQIEHRNQGVRGPAADLGRGATRVPTSRGADLAHRAEEVVSGHEGTARLSRISAPAHPLLGERHAAGLHLHQRLPGDGSGQQAPAEQQAVRLDQTGQDDLGVLGSAGLGQADGIGCAGQGEPP